MLDQAVLDAMDDAALDHLPFGLVRVGPTGLIERYNRAEATRAGIQRWRVMGRDFFREVMGPEGTALATEISLLPAGDHTVVQHHLRTCRKQVDVTIEVVRTDAGGAYLSISNRHD
jgi:hypothetical protein